MATRLFVIPGSHPSLTARLMLERKGIPYKRTHYNAATDEAVRADLEALPGYLDKVDGWIADGVLGSEEPNAALRSATPA